jgi:hypothetical protein
VKFSVVLQYLQWGQQRQMEKVHNTMLQIQQKAKKSFSMFLIGFLRKGISKIG